MHPHKFLGAQATFTSGANFHDNQINVGLFPRDGRDPTGVTTFTFYLIDPVHGDAFQQHDSRLQQGSNLQYVHPHKFLGAQATFTSGANFHDNQINVGLFPRDGRDPTGVTTRAHAHVTNEAGYAQESISLFSNRLILGAGIRYDEFRYNVAGALIKRHFQEKTVNPAQSGLEWACRWQGKGSVAFVPSRKIPLTLHANYCRGINSVDARGVVQMPDQPRLATTDFYQVGASANWRRFSFSTDAFLIDHSNEQVYIPDDGSFEFKGPSRAYGYEAKSSVDLTSHLSLNGGLTKIANAFFRGGDHRVYVDSAPHFVASAGLTLAGYRGWSGSFRMRAINHYRLDGDDPSIVAAGLTVFDAASTPLPPIRSPSSPASLYTSARSKLKEAERVAACDGPGRSEELLESIFTFMQPSSC